MYVLTESIQPSLIVDRRYEIEYIQGSIYAEFPSVVYM